MYVYVSTTVIEDTNDVLEELGKVELSSFLYGGYDSSKDVLFPWPVVLN